MNTADVELFSKPLQSNDSLHNNRKNMKLMKKIVSTSDLLYCLEL